MTTTEPGADERRIRRLLLQRGVGPDAGTATNPPRPTHVPRPAPRADWWDELYDDTAADTHAPTARTLPGRARIGGGRLPDWRSGQVADLSGPAPDTADAEADTKEDRPPTSADTDPDTADAEADGPEEWADTEDADDPVKRTPGRLPNPVRAGVRKASAAYAGLSPRIQWLAYNAAAAAPGYCLGVTHALTYYVASTGHAATGTIALALAAGGVVGAWKLTGLRGFGEALGILPVPPIVMRVASALGAAEVGRRAAPIAVTWLNQHAAQAGFGADTVSLLLTSSVLVGGLYLLVDRRTRHWWPPLAWACRIPLASAALAVALYAPGAQS